jgi:hypothetical protein
MRFVLVIMCTYMHTMYQNIEKRANARQVQDVDAHITCKHSKNHWYQATSCQLLPKSTPNLAPRTMYMQLLTCAHHVHSSDGILRLSS